MSKKIDKKMFEDKLLGFYVDQLVKGVTDSLDLIIKSAESLKEENWNHHFKEGIDSGYSRFNEYYEEFMKVFDMSSEDFFRALKENKEEGAQ